jgi:hypothetical protein
LLLPAHKVYEGDVRYDEKTEPHCLAKFIADEFATFKGLQTVFARGKNNYYSKNALFYRLHLAL